MASPQLRLTFWTCRHKRRHPNDLTARAAAMSHLQSGAADVDRLFVYPCPECRGWHLTKKNLGRQYMVTEDDLVYAGMNELLEGFN